MCLVNIQLTKVERQLALAVARKKTTDCDGYSSTIKMKDGFDYIGTSGEIAFANYMEVDWDWRSKKLGDGGIDFTINGYSIDVKTTKGEYHNRHLLVAQGKVRADIYVQCLHSPSTEGFVTLVGWAWGHDLLEREPVKWQGFYNFNHIMEHSDLNPMSNLKPHIEKHGTGAERLERVSALSRTQP